MGVTAVWSYLQLQHQVHSLLAQGVDVVEDQGNDDVDSIALMSGDAVLIMIIEK